MTQAEMTVAADLLRLAATRYHGTEDGEYNLATVLPDVEDRDFVLQRFHEHAGHPKCWNRNPVDNWELMLFLADELERDAGWCPTVTEQRQRDAVPPAPAG